MMKVKAPSLSEAADEKRSSSLQDRMVCEF